VQVTDNFATTTYRVRLAWVARMGGNSLERSASSIPADAAQFCLVFNFAEMLEKGFFTELTQER